MKHKDEEEDDFPNFPVSEPSPNADEPNPEKVNWQHK